jgi:osmoprotectant transport system permease protein
MILVILTTFLVLYISSEQAQQALLSFLYPSAVQYTHSRKTLQEMTISHVLLTLGATVIASVIGIALGIITTRGKGRVFLPLVLKLNAFIQTFPPSAVIILAFPFLGFGWKPALLALVLYSLFPVLGNTIVGFQSVDPAVIDAAKGMGMSGWQQLWIAQFPQALGLIMTGIRHCYILNLGTAAIASVIGGDGLGTIIISGLTLQNSALVLSGTLVISLLALIGEQLTSLVAVRQVA